LSSCEVPAISAVKAMRACPFVLCVLTPITLIFSRRKT
jgi:hypothetical protein